MSNFAAREAVLRGVGVLSAYDLEWYECIDLDKLSTRDPSMCVLGQYGTANIEKVWISPYTTMCQILGDDVDRNPHVYGFESWGIPGEDDDSYGYKELNQAWREVVLYLQEFYPS